MKLFLIAIVFAMGAYAETFDFESTTPGYYAPSLAVTNGGVTLTVTPEGFPNGFVDVDNSGVPLLGSLSVIGSQVDPINSDQFAPLRFTFSQPVTAITFAFGDAGGDDDSPVVISGYDASNNLLGTLSGLYPANDASGATLSGTFADADYFVLTSGPHTLDSNSDSIYWEVPSVTFDTTSSAPEPGTFLLLGAALLGVVGLYRSRIADRTN
jgi:hypothetical protein